MDTELTTFNKVVLQFKEIITLPGVPVYGNYMKSIVSGDVTPASTVGNYYIYVGTWVDIGTVAPVFATIASASAALCTKAGDYFYESNSLFFCTAATTGSAHAVANNAYDVDSGLVCQPTTGLAITTLLQCGAEGCDMSSTYKDIEVDRSNVQIPEDRAAPISNYITKVSTDLIYALYDNTDGLYDKLDTLETLLDAQTTINTEQATLLNTQGLTIVAQRELIDQ